MPFRSGAEGDSDGGVLFRCAEGIAIFGGHGDELVQLVGRWWPRGARPGDLLKELPESRGRDDQLDRRLGGDVSVGVRGAAGYVHIVTSVRVTPLQPQICLRQHLLRARQDKEVLGIVVAVQRHRDARGHHAAHHPEFGAGIVWAAHEFKGGPEHVHGRVRGSADNPAQYRAVEWVRWHVLRAPYPYTWEPTPDIEYVHTISDLMRDA